MKFSELKVGDYFYIEENGNLLPFEKVGTFRILPNSNHDEFIWNSRSLIKGSCHLMYCQDNLDVETFDRDGFY